MKTKYLSIACLAALACLFAACEPEEIAREASPEDDNSVQAYIFSNTSDITIRPADNNAVEITWAGGTYIAATPVFPVLVGRNVTTEALSFELEIEDEAGAFEFDPTVSFAAGEGTDTLWVTSLLPFGQSATLSIAIPEDYKYSYAPQNIDLAVAADYTWLPAGTVTMTSEWEGETGIVPIEQAKEYSAEDGSMLFRLNSPYYILAPDWCTVRGLHLQFYLNADYSAKDLTAEWNEVENTGYNWIYWTAAYIGSYEFFESEGNEYYLTCIWTEGENLYGPVTESWIWDDGYPGNE